MMDIAMRIVFVSLLALTQVLAADAAPARKSDVDLPGHSGKPVLLFFFAPDNPETAAALKAMAKLQQDFPGGKLAVIGVVPPGTREKQWMAALKSGGANFPVLQDKDNTLEQQCRVLGLPHVSVLDKNHRIAEWWPGYHPLYEPMIKRALKSVLR
ncbi:MAG TPA: TlpA disulfide reductase family protein [Elusimicrobiales bacterium]|nr:TlpA disulfide reductase family protein [Elusimicrobiales bacterium]